MKWLVRIAGVGIILYLGYFYYSLATGEVRMTQICSLMKPGMPTEQIIKLSKEYGLGPSMPKLNTKLIYLAESRSFGRHACRVELENEVVKSVAYSYAD